MIGIVSGVKANTCKNAYHYIIIIRAEIFLIELFLKINAQRTRYSVIQNKSTKTI